MSKKKEHDSPEAPHNTSTATRDEGAVADSAAADDTQKIDPPETPGDIQDTDTDDAPADSEAAADAEAPEPEKSPEAIIDELTTEIRAAGDRYLRLMAEFDNYKKRTVREYERMVESANEKLMGELIAVRETFELALKHGENGSDYQQLFEGIKLLFNKFDGVLTANGLVPFAAVGEPFDPQIHDALMKMPHAEIPEDHIADIHEKGYRLKDRVIKHARVIVSSGKPTDAPSGITAAAEDGTAGPSNDAAA
jgi:molecular chaperone GrpE